MEITKQEFKQTYKDFILFVDDDLIDTEEVVNLSIVQIDNGEPEKAKKLLADWKTALRIERFKSKTNK